MENASYLNGIAKGISHLISHRDSEIRSMEQMLYNIDTGSGNPTACMVGLEQHAKAMSLLAWFVDQDIIATKQWAYVAGKLRRIICERRPGFQATYFFFCAVLSDNEDIIRWFSHSDFVFNMKHIEDHKTFDFRTFQLVLALRGEWDRLRQRCEDVLADPPSKAKAFLIDYEFYLALSRGDQAEMEVALREMTRPKRAVPRLRSGDGFPRWFVHYDAVLYGKIAWRHGYKVKVDTPFVPIDWLPVKPLASYHDPYEFMKRY
jgi:hypothetical protein